MQENLVETLNKNRKLALDINKSIWVSASAGSGKTTILVDRLICLLLNDVDIKKVVCITYTNNAANEMKERIYKILEEWIFLTDNELTKQIQKINSEIQITQELLNKARNLFINVLDNVDSLRIFTIHSFCQQILTKFPLESGIAPKFTIIDEQKQQELVDKAINFVLDNIKNYSSLYSSFQDIISYVNEDDFYSIFNNIIKNRRDFENANGIDFKDELLQILELNETEFIFNDDLIDKNTFEEEFINKTGYVSDLAWCIEENDIQDKRNNKYLQHLPEWFRMNTQDKHKNLQNYISAFVGSTTLEPRKANSKIKKAGYEVLYNNEAQRCKKFFDTIQGVNCYNNSMDIIKLSLAIINVYKTLKQQECFLDYDDLIIFTNNLLKNKESSEWVKYKLDNKIEHLLLDEAQDTSRIQWQVIESLVSDFFAGKSANENKRSLFVVGDGKQSIFKFQGAAPELFETKYRYYDAVLSKDVFNKVNLDYSFRSGRTILKFVDSFFKDREYSHKITKIADTVEHRAFRDIEGYVEVWPLVTVNKEEVEPWTFKFQMNEQLEKEKINAEYIARKIKSFFDSKKQITAKNGKRYLNYNDVMVLVKDRSGNFLFYLIKYLNTYKIPNSGFDIVNLFETIYIKDILALLYFTLFPQDSYNLANIIKSPILELYEEDLSKLCNYKNDNKTTLFDALMELYPDLYAYLDNIIQKSKELSLYEFCIYLFDILDLRKKIFLHTGISFDSVINEFLNFVKKFENDNSSDIAEFLYFAQNNDFKIKKDFNTNKINQVRIMTMHSSKGLQAPIVFICNANKERNKDNKHPIFWYENEEYKLPLFKREGKSDKLTLLKNNSDNLDEEEYFRLFYVAMTRAENELYICGIEKGYSKDDEEGNTKKETKITLHDLAVLAITKMNCMAKPFDFNSSLTKYCVGEVEENDDSIKYIEPYKLEKETKKYVKEIETLKHLEINKSKMEIYAPSQFFKHNDRDKAFDNVNEKMLLGTAIHKLLEVLPNVEASKRNGVADIYLNNLYNDLSEEHKAIAKEKVNAILNDKEYSKFFSDNSRAEVAIIGECDGMNIAGQIDRLIEFDDKIVILDYKNTVKDYKTSSDIPEPYIKQLSLYKKILQQQYKKPIECYILLTNYFRMVKANL